MAKIIQEGPLQEVQELRSRRTTTGSPRTDFKKDHHRKPENCIQGRPSQETQERHSVLKLLKSIEESLQQVKIQELEQFPISLDCDWLLLLVVSKGYLIVIGYCCCWLLGNTIRLLWLPDMHWGACPPYWCCFPEFHWFPCCRPCRPDSGASYWCCSRRTFCACSDRSTALTSSLPRNGTKIMSINNKTLQ